MKTRSKNGNYVKPNYFPTGPTLTRGRRIGNQRRSARLRNIRRLRQRHQRHLDEGMPNRDFVRLPTVHLTAENKRNLRQRTCVICMGVFRVGQPVKLALPCHHAMHSGCLERWLTQTPTCPVCRACQPCELKKAGRRVNGELEE